MKLPGRDRAYVPERKLASYLLSLTHPAGKAKARFFRKYGFDISKSHLLKAELLSLARRGDVLKVEHTGFGTKYIIDGLMKTPSGDKKPIRTVWIVEDTESDTPRLVTAYPV